MEPPLSPVTCPHASIPVTQALSKPCSGFEEVLGSLTSPKTPNCQITGFTPLTLSCA